MSDNLMEKVNAFGERLKMGGAEVGRKMTAGMSSMSFKMKELFQGPNQVEKLVEDSTAETLDEPDWALNLELCDMINTEKINSIELIRGIKKRIMIKNNPRVQYLALVLLETIVKNCEKAFSEVAAERVLDEMVKLIDDPQTVVNNRNKALVLIEAWGESSDELRYLPVYEETYKESTDSHQHHPHHPPQYSVMRVQVGELIQRLELIHVVALLCSGIEYKDLLIACLQISALGLTKFGLLCLVQCDSLASHLKSWDPNKDLGFCLGSSTTEILTMDDLQRRRNSLVNRCPLSKAESLKSRGIRFPGRDSESLVPIFTPARSIAASEQSATLDQQIHHDIPVQSFTPEQTKEAFDVARNSIELLSTVLSSSPQQDALKDDLTTTLMQQCRQSQYTVQRIIETSGENEALLFEALNVNDEIQKVLSKYEDLEKPSEARREPEPAMIPVAVEPEESPRLANEDALIRKPAGARGGALRGGNDEMMDDLDEMIFGKKSEGGPSESGQGPKKPKDDLISF